MRFDINHYKKYIKYLVNNPVIEKCKFIEDWEPIGENILTDLKCMKIVYEVEAYGSVYLQFDPFELKDHIKSAKIDLTN